MTAERFDKFSIHVDRERWWWHWSAIPILDGGFRDWDDMKVSLVPRFSPASAERHARKAARRLVAREKRREQREAESYRRLYRSESL